MAKLEMGQQNDDRAEPVLSGTFSPPPAGAQVTVSSATGAAPAAQKPVVSVQRAGAGAKSGVGSGGGSGGGGGGLKIGGGMKMKPPPLPDAWSSTSFCNRVRKASRSAWGSEGSAPGAPCSVPQAGSTARARVRKSNAGHRAGVVRMWNMGAILTKAASCPPGL